MANLIGFDANQVEPSADFEEASQKLLKVERWSPGEQKLPSATFQFSSAATDGETSVIEARRFVNARASFRISDGGIFRYFVRGHVREMNRDYALAIRRVFRSWRDAAGVESA